MTTAAAAATRPVAGRLDGLALTTDTLAALYDAHGPRLYRYARSIVADAAAAEDVVQDTFVQVARALRRQPPPDVTYAYLATAVRNACYSALRRRRTWSAVIGRFAPRAVEARGAGVPLIEPQAPDASEEERLILESALLALPPEQREVIYLKVFEGLTFQEIARACGINANTAASRYRYAAASLRRALGTEGKR